MDRGMGDGNEVGRWEIGQKWEMGDWTEMDSGGK